MVLHLPCEAFRPFIQAAQLGFKLVRLGARLDLSFNQFWFNPIYARLDLGAYLFCYIQGAALMLSVSSVRSSGGAANYFAKDNYYTVSENEEAGIWHGKGASDLGLSGMLPPLPERSLGLDL